MTFNYEVFNNNNNNNKPSKLPEFDHFTIILLMIQSFLFKLV